MVAHANATTERGSQSRGPMKARYTPQPSGVLRQRTQASTVVRCMNSSTRPLGLQTQNGSDAQCVAPVFTCEPSVDCPGYGAGTQPGSRLGGDSVVSVVSSGKV